MAIKTRKALGSAFGANEAGLADLPTKMSNRRVSRLVFTGDRGGCSFCFPHGFETTNSTAGKNRRSWKHNRAHQSRARSG